MAKFTFLDYLWWIGEKAGMTSYARRMDGSTINIVLNNF